MHIVRRLRRAFLSICRCGDVMFSPYRLTTEQYSLMRAVQRDPGIRQVDLKDRIFAEPNTVTAMVTLLERRGILRRKPCATDGRARLLYLTAHGQTVLNRLSEDWEPMRAVLRTCFSVTGSAEALEILDAVYLEMSNAREGLLRRTAPGQLADRGMPAVDLLPQGATHKAAPTQPLLNNGVKSAAAKRPLKSARLKQTAPS